MQTIRRNTRRFKEVLEKAKDVKCYVLANNFVALDLEKDPIDSVAWSKRKPDEEVKLTTPSGYLGGILEMFSFARLTDLGGGKFRLRVHSNEWYESTN